MKKLFLPILASLVIGCFFVPAQAQTNFNTLSYLNSFGTNSDGSIHPGDAPYLTSTGKGGANFQRASAFNPLTGNLLLIDRQTNASQSTADIGRIVVLNGTNGSLLNILDTNGIAGGDLYTDAIGIADDGVVYLCNLVNGDNTLPLIIYRWSSDSFTNLDGTTNSPSMVYSGNPAEDGVIHESWGINMAVRGSGTNTQIICGTRSIPNKTVVGTNVAVFTTTDGTNFIAHPLANDTGVDDAFGRAGGITFGAGDTFWAISGSATVNPQLIRHMSFDLVNSNATTLHSFNTETMVPPFAALLLPAAGPAGLTVDVTNNLLAIFEMVTGTDHIRLYDIEDLANPPVLLDIKDMRVNIDNTIVGYPSFGGGRLYAHDLNAGIAAFDVNPSVGPYPPPTIITPPSPALQIVGPGANISYQVIAARTLTYQWQLNGVDLPGANTYKLTLNNVQSQDQGDYRVILGNSAGATTSSIVRLNILFPDDFAHLTNNLWSAAPTTRSYLPVDLTPSTGATPLYRSLAYNALSNQLYIVSRTNPTSGLSINVLDATTGADLYTLKTNGINNVGSIILLSIAVADDGAIYACNVGTGGASTTATAFRVYRWPDSSSNTSPVLIFSGDPVGTNNVRWGDSLAVRGSGTNTQILLDAGTGTTIGTLGAVLVASNSFMTNFISVSNGFSRVYNNATAGSIGRSLQFGSTNTLWQKRKGIAGAPLELSSFNLTNRNSTLLTSSSALPITMGPVGLDPARHLLAGINFKPTGSTLADTLDLYDTSDLSAPALLGSYDFPISHQRNDNFVGQVVFSADKVFALDGNNGVMALTIVPAITPTLKIVQSGSNVTISWTNSVSGSFLQSNTNLSSTNWINVTNSINVIDNQKTVTDALGNAAKFYRLSK